MSIVTNLLISITTFDVDEDDKIKEINQFFEDYDQGSAVSLNDPKLPNGWYGGTKFLEADLYCGAFNHLDLDELVNHINNLEWPGTCNVQLIVQEQDEIKFRIIDVIDK